MHDSVVQKMPGCQFTYRTLLLTVLGQFQPVMMVSDKRCSSTFGQSNHRLDLAQRSSSWRWSQDDRRARFEVLPILVTILIAKRRGKNGPAVHSIASNDSRFSPNQTGTRNRAMICPGKTENTPSLPVPRDRIHACQNPRTLPAGSTWPADS